MKQTVSVICGIILLFLGACGIKEWTMPTWDVTVRIPLINEKYFILDLADGENLIIAEDNVLVMQGSGSLSTPNFGSLSLGADINSDPIPITANHAVTLDFPLVDPVNNYELVYGVLESGVFETLFTDIDPSVQSIRIIFQQISRPDTTPLEIIYEAPGVWTATDLTGCLIGAPNSNQIIDEINISINSVSSAPDGTVIGQLRLRNQGEFRFSEFKGVLHGYRLDLDGSATTLTISYPMGIEQAVTLTEARLAVMLDNYVGFECTFHGEFFAQNSVTGETFSLPILDIDNQPFSTVPANGDTPGVSQFIMEENVTDLLQIMPDIIEIRNAYFIVTSTPSMPIGTVRMTDYIHGDYTISSPFRFILHNSPIEVADPVKVEISEQNRDRIRKNVRSVSFELGITNRLPIGAQAKVYIGLTPEINVNDPETYSFMRSMAISSANANPSQQNINIGLNNAELMVFTNPEVYLKWVFHFESSGGLPVTITATTDDYIQLKSMLIAEIYVGKQQ